MHLTQHQIRAAFRRVMCELTRAKQRERERERESGEGECSTATAAAAARHSRSESAGHCHRGDPYLGSSSSTCASFFFPGAIRLATTRGPRHRCAESVQNSGANESGCGGFMAVFSRRFVVVVVGGSERSCREQICFCSLYASMTFPGLSSSS